jgi:hypothetical protein
MTASLGYFGYGVEATEGTAVAPTKFLPVTSVSFDDTNDYILPEQIRGSRDFSIAMAAPYNVAGTFDLELVPLDIAYLLKSAFCATVATSAYAGGGYQHVFTPASEEKAFSAETSAGNNILVMRYAGCRVNTFEVKAAHGEIVTATFAVEGSDRTKQGSPATPSYAACTPFHFSGVTVKANGNNILAYVKEFTFGVNNNLERIGTLRKTRGWRRMALGAREVTLSMTLDFTDTTEYDRFLNETSFDVDLIMEAAVGSITGLGSNAPTLRIQIPQVKWTKVSVPLSAGDLIEQSCEATITKGAGAIFTATLVNNENTVP